MPNKRHLPLFSFKPVIPIVFLLIMILILFLSWPVKGLVVITEGEVLFFFPSKAAQEFALIYEHSVMKTEVKDVFTLASGELLMLRTEYESFGAGLPTEAFENFTKVEGRYINDGIDLSLPQIRLRTGRTTNHRLMYNEASFFTLDDFVEPGSLIVIEEKTMTTLESLFY